MSQYPSLNWQKIDRLTHWTWPCPEGKWQTMNWNCHFTYRGQYVFGKAFSTRSFLVFYTAHTVTLSPIRRSPERHLIGVCLISFGKCSGSPPPRPPCSPRLRLTTSPQIAQGIEAPEPFELNSHLPCRLHLPLSSATVVYFHVHQKLMTFGEHWTPSRVAAGKVGHSRTRVVWAVWEPERMFWNLAWFQLGTLHLNFLTSLVLAA